MEKMVLEYQQRSHQSFRPLPICPSPNQDDRFYSLDSLFLHLLLLVIIHCFWDNLQICFPIYGSVANFFPILKLGYKLGFQKG